LAQLFVVFPSSLQCTLRNLCSHFALLFFKSF
jgi:hypothetical protein